MNPIILADNRFSDGTPTATDTAAGYDVLNIRDMRTYTAWKAASAGTKYVTGTLGVSAPADCLAIAKHNFGTAGASVSVESSANGTDWTQRLAPFTPADDRPLLKTFASATGYWRVKLVTAVLAPQMSICMVGTRIDFPFPPEGPFTPASERVEGESTRSKTGQLIGTVIRFKPYTITASWSFISRTFVEDTLLPFWERWASNLHPFFFAWDLTVFPYDVRFVKVTDGYEYATPVSVLAYYDSFRLDMEGVNE